MNIVEISLPERLKAIVDHQIACGRFSSESEYFCRLIEEDEHRRAQIDVESLLLARVAGTDIVEMNSADWKQMREEFHRRVATRSSR